MRKVILPTILALFLTIALQAQTTRNYSLKANMDDIRLDMNGDVINEKIPFSPEKGDTLLVQLYMDSLDFRINTDIDSLHILLHKDDNALVTIEKEGMHPIILNILNGIETVNLEFDSSRNPKLKFAYEKGYGNPYLQKLKTDYNLDSIAAPAKNDIERVKLISSWVHNLWQHDGDNQPEKSDAIYILEEVKKGKRYRCVEYGIVTTACLNALGLPSRTLSLKTKDAETTPYGAGHVVMEVFLKDMNKWIMVDPQMDAIPYSEGKPLNAVEFQRAMTEKKDLVIESGDPEFIQGQYEGWIYPYLYYFSYSFDNRENIPAAEVIKYNDKTQIMLVPIGAKEPTVFQLKYPIDYCIYSNSISDFYNIP